MKAIYVHQPWASAVVLGAVNVINIRKPTTHRGDLLIVARRAYSQSMREKMHVMTTKHPHWAYLSDVRSAILGIVNVVSVDYPDECGHTMAWGPYVLSIDSPRILAEPIPWGGGGGPEEFLDVADSQIDGLLAEVSAEKIIADHLKQAEQEQLKRMTEDEPAWRASRRDGFTND